MEFSDTFKDYFSRVICIQDVVISMIQHNVFLILKNSLILVFGNVLNIFITDLVKGKFTRFTGKPKCTESQRNGKISHALGLEELILLKWPYYPKQPTDFMRSLSDYP